jgi:glycosyltransferase involved in cell wall biosynthesis
MTELIVDVVMILYDNDLTFDARVKREAEALAVAGFSVTILASKSVGTPLVEETNGYMVERFPDALNQMHDSMVHRVLELKPRVIHGHDLVGFLLAREAWQKIDALLIYDSHELWSSYYGPVSRPTSKDRRNRRLEESAIYDANAVITVSDACATHLQSQYGLENLTVVRNVSAIPTVEESVDLHQLLGLDPDWNLIVYLGADTIRGRGLHKGLEAISGMDRTALVLVGPEPEGRGRKFIEWAREHGYEERLFLLGMQPLERALALVAGADVGLCLHEPVSESIRSSLPNKLFQYGAAGIPVVASELPDITTVVNRYSLGRLVDPSKPDQIRRAIEQTLLDPAAKDRLITSRENMAREISWDQEKSRLIHLYSDLIGAGSGVPEYTAPAIRSSHPPTGTYRFEWIYTGTRRSKKRWKDRPTFEAWTRNHLKGTLPNIQENQNASESITFSDDGLINRRNWKFIMGCLKSRSLWLWVGLEDHFYDMECLSRSKLVFEPIYKLIRS